MFVPKLTSVWMYSSVFVHFCTGNKKESDQQISFLSHLGCIFVIPALELINVCHYVTVLFYNFSWTDLCLMWGLRRWCSIMWREIQNNLCFYTPLLTVVSPTLFCTFDTFFFLRKKCEPWKLKYFLSLNFKNILVCLHGNKGLVLRKLSFYHPHELFPLWFIYFCPYTWRQWSPKRFDYQYFSKYHLLCSAEVSLRGFYEQYEGE